MKSTATFIEAIEEEMTRGKEHFETLALGALGAHGEDDDDDDDDDGSGGAMPAAARLEDMLERIDVLAEVPSPRGSLGFPAFAIQV